MVQFQEDFTLGKETCPIRMGHGFHPQKLIFQEVLDPIFQNGAMLFYVEDGSGTLMVNGQPILLKAGCFG